MPLTEDQYKRVENIIQASITHDPVVLSEWELDFANSTADRLAKYEEDTLFSDKQMAVIDKIEKKLQEAGEL